MRGRWNVACGSALGALALGIASPVAAQDGATDYPQWRGRARDGSASAFVAPARWPETLTRRWATDVGEGYATPLVIGETVYTFTRQNDDEVATALDAATGDVVWRTAYPAPYEMFSGTAHHGEGPKATPLFHDGRLYTHGISGAVSAFDGATGDIVWQIPAPDIQPLFGTAISPLADGLLFLLNDDAELIVGRIGRAGLERIRGYTVADSATWAQPAISGNRLFIKDIDTVALWTVD